VKTAGKYSKAQSKTMTYKKQAPKVTKDSKMEAARASSKFKGLATVVEMMMEVNCPMNLHMSDGIGTDNMTCIIIDLNQLKPVQ
jgi:hypothetical protein